MIRLKDRDRKNACDVTFDYLNAESDDFYTFTARIMLPELEDGSTQMLIINLESFRKKVGAKR